MNRFGFSVTPIYRKTREVQFAAGGRQIAPTVPFIDARIFGFFACEEADSKELDSKELGVLGYLSDVPI